MQSVTDRWYVIYARIAVGLAAVLFIVSCIGSFIPPAAVLQDLGFSYVTSALSLATILYFIFFYKHETEKNTLWGATFQLSLILTLAVINVIHNSGGLHSWFVLVWFVIIMAYGIFGTYALAACSFLTICYFILFSTDELGRAHYDTIAVGVLVVSLILTITSRFIWHRHYIVRESQQITELSKTLKNNQLQSEALVQAIADGVVVIDPDGKIIMMNPAASAMTNWPLDEALGVNVMNVMSLTLEDGQPIDVSQNPFMVMLQKGGAASHTLNLIGRNGTKQIVSLIISPIKQPNSQAVIAAVAVFRDITAAKAEEKRRADFISTASHEMRTPVAAIEGYLALALNTNVSSIDGKARSFLEKAHSSTQHLGQLFQDLLTSAKAEDGRLVSHPVVVEMGTYLEQLTDTLKFAAQKKGLLTDFVIGTATSNSSAIAGNRVIRPLYYTLVDPDRMREVITNLFDNAVKYTESGKISIGLTGNNQVVQFYIRDTGGGIAKEDIPHLFQKFYRVDNSVTRTIGGTGLGLFICRKIVELYNGRIWVNSEPDKGSTFFINVPRITTQQAAELQRRQAQNGGILPV